MRGLTPRNFASQRTIREGSVGLLLLLGLGVLGGFFLWMNRINTNRGSYKFFAYFDNAAGIQKGAPVRYRGFQVGRISRVIPKPDVVDVEIEITQPDLIIPIDSTIETNQTGLISENIIEITPRSQGNIPVSEVKPQPTDKDCQKKFGNLIVCNASRLKGNTGISFDQLIRSATKLADTLGDEKLLKNLTQALDNANIAAVNVAQLSKNLNNLTSDLKGNLQSFSSTARSVENAANTVSASAIETIDKFGNTADKFGDTATKLNTTISEFGQTAKDFSTSSKQVNKLINNLDAVVTENRSTLATTLTSMSKTSGQLSALVNDFSPAVKRITQGELIKNFETLSANAAEASANIRDISKSLNDPKNIVVLQQTLDSARVTFENTQKITSDLDELTGDPKFRDNLRRLVNGLSSLVSSTEQIQQQVQFAQTLDSAKTSIITAQEKTKGLTNNNPQTNAYQQQRQAAIQRLEELLKQNQGNREQGMGNGEN